MVAHEPSHNRDGPRKLGKRTFVRRRPSTKHFSASGKMSLIAVAFTTIILGSRNASATNSHRAASPIPHRPWNLSQLRGGSKSDRILSSKKGGDQDLDDEDLDEYIDFLLAYADDKATEADNPLFHGMESNQIEQDDQEEQDEQEEDEKQDVEEDLGVKPLVNDVNDDKQIDEMVETLIASVDDEDVEGATKLEIQSEESSEEIEMVTTSLVAKEIETAQDISAESAPEEITAGIMAEGTELTGVLSLKEEENIGEVAADFAAEEVAVEIVEEEIEVITPDLSVEEVERIEEVVGESAAEVTPTASLEDDIGLATTDSSVQEVENIESTYAETTTEDIPETAFVEIQTPVNDSIVEANTEDSASETPVVEMVNDEKKISSHSDIDEESIEQVESESFYLGSSAVENMPVPSVVSLSNLSSADDDAALSADAALTAQPTKRVPLFTSLMRKIGLRKEEPGSSDAATVDASQEGETVSSAEETVEVHEKTESAIESSNVMELTTTSTTESETQLNAAKEITDTDRIEDVVLDSSDGSEEPSITVAELDRETSVSEDVDIVVQVEDTAEDEISSETETLETSEAIALDSADEVRSQQVTTRVTSLARQYYQGAWGSVKDLWSKKRWLRKETEDSPPERDYMKIYQKYYATNHQTLDADVNPSQERRNRVSSAFLRPWGTVSKYFKSPEQSEATSTTTNYYSIGIQGFVPDDLTADASSEAYGDDENGNVVETDVAFAEMEVGDDEVAVEEEELSVAEALDTEETSGSVDDLDRLVDEDVICEEEHEEAPVLSEAEVQVDSETVYKIDSDVANDDVAIKEEEASDVAAEALEIEESSNSVEDLNLQVDDDEEQQLFLVSEAEVYSEVANESEIETDVDDGVAIEEEEAPVVTEEAPDIEETSDSVEDLDLQIDEDSALEEEKEEEVVVEKEEAPVVSDTEVGVDSEAVNEIEVDVVESELEVDDGVAIEEEDASVVIEEALEIEESSESIEDLELVDEGDEDEEEVRAVDDTEDDVEVSLESTTDIDNADDATDDTSVDRSRPRRFFTRLWGTRKKVHQFRSDVEVDNEKDQSLEVEESDPEDQAFGEQEENITTKSSHQPNVLVRLWGTMKEPNEVYSLGIQGTKHSSFEEDEQTEVISDGDFESISESDTDETIEEVMEELEVDISVSIGNTEEGDGSLDVETFDISESSNVEDSEDEIDFSELDDIHEQETTVVDPEKNTAMEVGNDDRNVLQLHSPESQDIAQHASQASIEIKSDAAGSKDLKTSSSSHRLELRREDCDSLTLEDVSEEQNTAVATHAVSESNKIGSVDFDSDESESIGDVDGINEESVEDEGESIVLDMIEDVLSEEEEDPIEELPEGKGTEHSVATEVAEDLLSVEEDSVEEVDVEEDTEGSVVAEAIEDMFSEEEGDSIAEESQEDDIYEDTIYEDASSLYSLEVELENTNFLTRFFVNKGLEKFVMIVFLIMEWFRVYVLAPFFESIDWIKKGKGQDLLQTVMSTRGGALASSVSDSEDLHELEDEDDAEVEVEVEEGEGEGTYPNDDESQPRDSAESEKEALGEIESVESKQVPADISVPTQPRVPPNFVFRRLLNYGRIGHIVIMEMIMASEWLKAYVPQIPYLAGYIFHDLLKNKRRSSRDRDEPVNKRNSGFINIGEGSRLGRKPKKLRKKEDQNALDQLKRIGDVNEAKYRFLSQKFMERHALGPYSATISEVQVDLRALEPDLASKNNQDAEEVEAESDSGWILDALGVEDDEEDDLAPPGSPFDTSIGVSLGGGGPKVSVGMEFKLGRKKKSIKTSQKLRSVFDNDSMASKNKIKTPKPRVSDSESGVMGRLRAAGANSLVGRNILGAYPGDLPPPDEAANARGVIRLARRYGYGDWSDGDNDDDHEFGNFFDEQDDDDDDDEFLDHFSEEENLPRPKQRSSTSSAKKKKTRKRRSSSREMKSAGVSFEFSSGSSKNSRISSGSSRTTTKRRRSSSSSSSSSVADSISTVRRRKSSRSRLPSSPMEKLGRIPKSTTPTAKKTIISKGKTSTTNGLNDASSLTIKRKKKTTPLRPAGALLDEAKSSAISSNED